MISKVVGEGLKWQQGQSTALGQGVYLYLRAGGGKKRKWREKSSSGDKTATDANRVVRQLPGPEAFEIDAHRREDGNVKNGEESVR